MNIRMCFLLLLFFLLSLSGIRTGWNNICLVNYYLNLRHDSISQMGVCT